MERQHFEAYQRSRDPLVAVLGFFTGLPGMIYSADRFDATPRIARNGPQFHVTKLERQAKNVTAAVSRGRIQWNSRRRRIGAA